MGQGQTGQLTGFVRCRAQWADRTLPMADHCHKTNPRIAMREDYGQMLEASM
jgi:alcohol dehydrogenase class IV